MTTTAATEAPEGRPAQILASATIQEEMVRQGLTVRDLAAKLDVRRKTVDGWLSGTKRLLVSDFAAIANACASGVAN